jgi:hypothetical protein
MTAMDSELRWLREQLDDIVASGRPAPAATAPRLRAALAQPPLPRLATLADRLAVSPHGYAILLTCVGAASSLEIAGMLERVQGDPVSGGVRSHVLGLVVGRGGAVDPTLLAELAPDAPLRRWRLVERRDEQVGAAFERWLAPRAVVAHAHGTPSIDEALATVADLLELPAEAGRELARDDCERLARVLAAGHVASVSALDSASAVRGLAGLGTGLGLRTIRVDVSRLPARGLELCVRDALLVGALLVVECGPDAAQQRFDEIATAVQRAREGAIPCVVVEASARAPLLARATDAWLRLRPPAYEVRVAHWRRTIEDEGGVAAPDVVERAADTFTIGVAAIERAARRACHAAEGPISLADLGASVAADAPAITSTLGELDVLDPSLDFDALIVPPEVRDDLLDLLERCRYRRRVLDDMQLGRLVTGRGVVALLTGPPGTGKTLAARVLSAHLGLRLLRVDLSRVVSKWIGETEKNLAQVLDACEEGRFMILFDECDALFGKRTTEAKTSTDRYANMEINFLLQRLDVFDGIAVLTSNLERGIDEAFKRRLAARIEFPMPDEEAREQLWRALLPAGAPLAAAEVRSLAEVELSGGYIRNAVLRAAFRAAGADQTPGFGSYVDAVQLELRAQGKLVPHRPRDG